MSPPPEAMHDAPAHNAPPPRVEKARFIVPIEDPGMDDELTREFTLSTADLDLEKLMRDAVAHQRAHQLAQENARKHAQIGTAAVTEVQTKAQKKAAEGEPKQRKPIPKLNDERLLGDNGFPALLKEYKKFKPKGKGHEQEDLTRLLQLYQFWTHKMFPKMQFDDAVARVEKVCHSRRMLITMSVWKDEARNGPRKPGQKDEEDEDQDDKDEDEGAEDRANRSSPGRPSPSSVAAASTNDDNWTVDEMIAAEARKQGRTSSPAPPPASSPEPDEYPDDDDPFGGDPAPSKLFGDDLDAEEMNLDWESFDDEPIVLGGDSPPPQAKKPTAPAPAATQASMSTSAPTPTQQVASEDFDMDLDDFDVFGDFDIDDELPSKPQASATDAQINFTAPTPAPAKQPAADTDELDLLDDGELSQEELDFLEEAEMYN